MHTDILTLPGIEQRLALMGQLLTAMETGVLPMHATDYLETALSVKAELARLNPATLLALRRQLPASFVELVAAALESGEAHVEARQALCRPMALR